MRRGAMSVLGAISLLLLIMTACGGGGEDATPTTAPPAPTTPPPAAAFTPTPTFTPAPTSDGGGVVTLEIGTPDNQLKFDLDFMSAAAGSTVLVRYINDSTVFQHSWVLVEAGTKDEVTRDGGKFPDNGYVQPGDDRVIAAIIPLVEPGEVGEVRFQAPAAGTYEFVCTFPGHNATKFGTFEVK